MNLADIIEFRTTWKNEVFLKNKINFLTAKRLIKKSIVIVQARLCRRLKLTKIQLETDRQLLNNYRNSNSLNENLEQRLCRLKNEIQIYNLHIKNLVKQEKDYWKELEQTIARRTNLHKSTTNCQPVVVVNATFVTHVDKNNENLPPLECQKSKKTPVKQIKNRNRKKKLNA